MAERYPQHRFTPPPGSTFVTLIRHGQSQAGDPANPFPLVDGHGDPPLTDLGHQQAAAVGHRLKEETFDAIYASSLTRTHETAAPLVAHTGTDLRIERDLREIFLGEWEGGLMRKYTAEGTHPAVAEFRRTGDWGAIPGAESNAVFSERCVGAVRRIVETHPQQHVALFVHGGVIGALCGHATRGALMGFAAADNGSIHRLVVSPQRWFLRAFNDINHLDGVETPLASAQTIAP